MYLILQVFAASNIDQLLEEAEEELMKRIDKFEQKGSGWVLHRLLTLDLHIDAFVPLRASSYIPTPDYIAAKKAVINLQNEDNGCFQWAYLAATKSNEIRNKPHKVRHYRKYVNELNMKGLEMPLKITDIPRFERQNDCSVSVYGYEENFIQAQEEWERYVYPLKVAREMKTKHVDMLLISDGEKTHYCWIKNMSKLLAGQYTKYNGELAYCRFCCHGFYGKAVKGRCTRLEDAKRRRDEHEIECYTHNGQLLVFPEEDYVEFKNIRNQVEEPFVVYADFESTLKPIDEGTDKTRKYQEHQACSFAYTIVSRVPGIEFEPKLYLGEDAPERLLTELQKDYREKIKPYIDEDKDMIFGDEERAKFDAATDCHICNKPLEEDRVRDHSHLDGSFRGAAHSNCNLQYQIPKENYKLPIIFHNLRGYDAHLTMLGIRKKHGRIRVIPMNMERYISFSIGCLKFLDSMQFLNSSLEKLASALKPEQFVNLKTFLGDIGTSKFVIQQSSRKRKTISDNQAQNCKRLNFIDNEAIDECEDSEGDDQDNANSCDDLFIDDDDGVTSESRSFYRAFESRRFKENTSSAATEERAGATHDEKFNLLSRKQVYCYDYFTDMSRFEETSLPTKEQFYNRLHESHISDADYEHVAKVWEAFGCATLRDFHDVYLLSDILLLADVFEKFRNIAHETYKLEPLHYYSLPGFAWDAALKHTGVQIELIKDIDMFLMVKKAMRGGICVITHRKAEANHPGVPNYDPEKPESYLMYLDANSLYAWAMTQPLPINGFKWVDADSFDLSSLGKDGKGHILEIDCHIPDSLHDQLNDYPPAPQKMNVSEAMHSPLQKEMGCKAGNIEKLIPNFYSKTKYVVHHHALQQYIKLGLQVTKIHRVFEFNERCWLKSFIDLNTIMRQKAMLEGDKAGVGTYKLMSNAVFGKSCENLLNRVNVEIVNSKKVLKKRIAKPNFKRTKVFSEDLVAVDLAKTKIELNRPIQVGFSILEISKTLIYDFHYDKWMPRFPEAKLLFTDTDSLCYKVNRNPYDVMATFADEFDFSDYEKDHPLYDDKNMKVLGKFKDECLGQPLLSFRGLRPKLYCMEKMELGKNELTKTSEVKGKGLTASVRKKQLSINDFERCLQGDVIEPVIQRTIRSDHHKLFTYEMKKIGLTAGDDKRWICSDRLSTLAHGHYKTR